MKHEPVIGTEFTIVRQTRHGWLAYNRNDKTIGKSLSEYGEWAEAELSGCLLKLLREGDLVVDAGAHIGTHTIAFAKAVGQAGTVLAIEPQLWAHYYLCANVALNSLDNVVAVRGCLGYEKGTETIAQLDQRKPQNYGALSAGSVGDTVPVVPIDGFELDRCRLIKLDVEGYEMAVLRGAVKTIHKYQPIVFCETNRPTIVADLWHFFTPRDYQLFWFSSPFSTPDNFYGSTVEHHPGIGEISILAVNAAADIGGLVRVAGPDDTWDQALGRWRASQKT